MENFFISCPLGLEQLALDELKVKWSLHFDTMLPDIIIHQGGLELNLELQNGLALNHILKSSNRILLRLKTQKCRDIPKLFNIIFKINWKKYLKRSEVQWNITCHESRLFNSNKIEKACSDALIKYFNANKFPQKIIEMKEQFHIQQIFLRFNKDELTISLDTTGDLLHIRGGDDYRGHASIRSTIASLLLQKLIEPISSFTLIDPMCGTGTFLKETRDFYLLSQRAFAYLDWHPAISLATTSNRYNYISLIGFDIDQHVINKVSTDNTDIKFECRDVFKLEPYHCDNPVVICNPPYGKRVKLDKPREIFYSELLKAIRHNFKPKKIGILIPKDISLKGYQEKFPVFNSGIWLDFYIFEN